MWVYYGIKNCFWPIEDQIKEARRVAHRNIRSEQRELRKADIQRAQDVRELDALIETSPARAKALSKVMEAREVRQLATHETIEVNEHMLTTVSKVHQSIQTANVVHVCADIVAAVHGTSDPRKIFSKVHAFERDVTELKNAQDEIVDVTTQINHNADADTSDDILQQATDKSAGGMATVPSKQKHNALESEQEKERDRELEARILALDKKPNE